MNWRNLFSNPFNAAVTVAVILIFAKPMIAIASNLALTAVNQLAGPLLLLGLGIYAFRWMTRRR
jgi:hypothetical protein